MLSRLSILYLAGGSSHRCHKHAASRTPRPESAEIESESDQETLASRRAQIDEQRKKKKAVQITLSDMTKNEFIEWHRTDFYAKPHDYSIDNCFWSYDQEILFRSEERRVGKECLL